MVKISQLKKFIAGFLRFAKLRESGIIFVPNSPSRSETPGRLLTLKKREVGGRLSKVSPRRSTVGSRRSAIGTFSKLFLLMIFLIKNFSGASRRIQKGYIFSDISWWRSAINCCCLIFDANMQDEILTWIIRKLFNNTHNFLRLSRDRLLTQISSAVGGRRSGRLLLGSFLLGFVQVFSFLAN